MTLPKHAELWLSGLLRDRFRHHLALNAPPKRLHIAITDHYEPMGGSVSVQTGLARVAAWQRFWPRIADDAPRDDAGRPACYTFFYPQEEYDRSILDQIASLCRLPSADTEVHLHHDHDTAPILTEKLLTFTRRLHDDHGLLRTRNGRIIFAFIHGNWALDNGRPDGRWCGVTGELALLRSLGCYADFTMPAAPSPAQSRIVNSIYFTAGDPTQPRGFDTALPAAPGTGIPPEGLLMVNGPFGLRLRERLIPRLETGELAVYDPPTPHRVQRWIALAPRLGQDIFLKLYAHGAREDNAAALLGTSTAPGSLAPMFRWIAQAAAQHHLQLHYHSAFSMFQAIERILLPASEPQPITHPAPLPAEAPYV